MHRSLIGPLLLLPTLAVAAPSVSLTNVGGTCDTQPTTRFRLIFGGLTPGGSYAVVTSALPGSATVPGGSCAGTALTLDASSVRLRAVRVADDLGTETLSLDLPSSVCSHWLQLLDLTTCEVSTARLLPTDGDVFLFTGAPETFTVPAGVDWVEVDAYGGAGGDGEMEGGHGGRVITAVPVVAGQPYEVRVGGEGAAARTIAVGGYNGGGSVAQLPGVVAESGAGGGASDFRKAPYGLDDRLVVAAGGGGGGSAFNEGYGGAGGGLEGEDGGSIEPDEPPGGGGTQTAGGEATQDVGLPNEPGDFGVGGDCTHDTLACGAGGGGWYGGGGGLRSGGGGGSSYVHPTTRSTLMVTGAAAGVGLVRVRW